MAYTHIYILNIYINLPFLSILKYIFKNVSNKILFLWGMKLLSEWQRRIKGENSFFSDTEAFFFNNAGTAPLIVCAVTTIKPMAAAKLHSLWLEGPPKAIYCGHSPRLLRFFSPSATTTRSSFFETRSLRR